MLTPEVRGLFWALAVIVCTGCGSSEEGESWHVGDETPPAAPLSPGIYEAEFEIVEDTCDPSLESLFGKVERWPPPQVPVFGSEADAYNSLGFNTFNWRDGRIGIFSVRVDGAYRPYAQVFHEDEWATLIGFSDGRPFECEFDLATEMAAPKTRMTLVQVEENVFEVRVEAEFAEFRECVADRHYERFAMLPRDDCSESYRTRYTLVEECAPPCEVISDFEDRASERPGYNYKRVEEPIQCEC